MMLEIINLKDEFLIKGNLNKSSLPLFQSTFQNIFEQRDKVVLNIEQLKAIDRDGVCALAKLHNESINRQKKLSIVGFGCKELYQHFDNEDAA